MRKQDHTPESHDLDGKLESFLVNTDLVLGRARNGSYLVRDPSEDAVMGR